ncbi:hypothetical protein BAE44_0020178 [Dichanthelium oligosanthes]|uniref:Uncharacterized protein n=1 Tax=Dichanthelium oligosanthes TaxID=888268 RepID=A0A1E5V0X6_9POAL|nr:hypothetical protein BAE44_0020178 [Dichanthelium oligosanthes]
MGGFLLVPWAYLLLVNHSSSSSQALLWTLPTFTS